MDFDPDAYLQKIAAPKATPPPAFDPDAYLAKAGGKPAGSFMKSATDVASKLPPLALISMLGKEGAKNPDMQAQSMLEHGGNAATLGYLPQLQAKAEPLTDRLFNAASGQNVEPAPMSQLTENGPEYVAARDANIRRMQGQGKDFPIASGLGTVAGIGAGAAMNPAGPIQGASALARMGKAASVGAGYGLAANPGDTEGVVDPLQAGDRLSGAGKGALLGGGAQGIAEGIGRIGAGGPGGGGGLAGSAGSFAEKKAFKALGPFKRQVTQNADDINRLGRTALDEGVVGGIPTSHAGLAGRAEDAAASSGQSISDISSELGGLPDQPSGVPRKAIADRMRQQLMGNPEIPGVGKRNDYFNGLIDEFEAGKGDIDFNKARELKLALGGGDGSHGLIKWDRLPSADIPPEEQFHRSLYGHLKDSENELANSIEKGNYGEQSSRFQDEKSRYGDLKTIEGIASNKANSEMANRMLGLTDTISAAGAAGVGAHLGEAAAGFPGAKVGAVAGGALGAMGNKLGRTYGNQVMATGADALSKFLAQSPKLAELAQRNPSVLPQIQALVDRSSQTQMQESPENPGDKLMQRFKDNPNLIDGIQNERLKAQISQRLGREPTSEKDASKEPVVPIEKAQQQFIQGN